MVVAIRIGYLKEAACKPELTRLHVAESLLEEFFALGVNDTPLARVFIFIGGVVVIDNGQILAVVPCISVFDAFDRLAFFVNEAPLAIFCVDHGSSAEEVVGCLHFLAVNRGNVEHLLAIFVNVEEMIIHVQHRAQVASEAAAFLVLTNLFRILLGCVDGISIVITANVEAVVDDT